MPESKSIVIPYTCVKRARPYGYSSRAAWDAFAAAVPPSGLVLHWREVRQIARVAGIGDVVAGLVERWIPEWLYLKDGQYRRTRLPRHIDARQRTLELLYFWLTKTLPIVK